MPERVKLATEMLHMLDGFYTDGVNIHGQRVDGAEQLAPTWEFISPGELSAGILAAKQAAMLGKE